MGAVVEGIQVPRMKVEGRTPMRKSASTSDGLMSFKSTVNTYLPSLLSAIVLAPITDDAWADDTSGFPHGMSLTGAEEISLPFVIDKGILELPAPKGPPSKVSLKMAVYSPGTILRGVNFSFSSTDLPKIAVNS